MCKYLWERIKKISIHALREEGDFSSPCLCAGCAKHFYPRPPRGGRREDIRVSRKCRGISIHALREEGDAAATPDYGRA